MSILPVSYNFSPPYSCDPVQISLDRTHYLRVGGVYHIAYKSFDRSSKPDTKIWLLIFLLNINVQTEAPVHRIRHSYSHASLTICTSLNFK
jgi:hypothetical protein